MATDLIEALVTTQPDADLATVARAACTSSRTLQRVLATEGDSFLQLRSRVRLRLAFAGLARGDKVDAVARTVGFRSTPHFCVWFRMLTGLSPSAGRTASTLVAASVPT